MRSKKLNQFVRSVPTMGQHDLMTFYSHNKSCTIGLTG